MVDVWDRLGWGRRCVWFVLWGIWVAAGSAAGQVADEPGLRISRPEECPGEAWVELTPLATSGKPQTVVLAAGQREGVFRSLRSGRAMLCRGGESEAVGCEQIEVQAGAEVAVACDRGVELTGRFVEGSRPVASRVRLAPAGTEVAVRFTMPLARDDRALARERASGAEGRFQIPRLAPGAYLLEAELETGRVYRSDEFVVPRPEEMRPGGDNRPVLDLGDMVVEPGLTVEFLVTDIGSQPLAGATAGYSQQTGPELTDVRSFGAETGAEGKASVSGVDPALPGSAVCYAAGHTAVRQDFEVPPPLVECALEPLVRIEGEIVDLDGEAIADATVTIQNPGKPGARFREETDDEGRFSAGDLQAARYELIVAKPGFAIERLTVSLDPGDERHLGTIELRPGRELWGVALDGETGEPVPAAGVEVTDPAGGGSALTDEDGEFRLTIDFEETLRLRVASDSHAPRTVEVEPSRLDAEEPLEIELSAGGRVLAVVFDDEGRPCTGCRVRIDRVGELRTDHAGEALSQPAHPGTYTVHRIRPRSRGTLITLQTGSEVKTAEVRAGQTTTVRLGEPRSTLEIAFDRPLPPGWNLWTRGSSSGRHRPQPDGVFRIRWRPGEPTELYLAEDIGYSDGLRLVDAAGFPAVVRVGRVPADHEAPRLELKLWGTLVSGRLLADDLPAAEHRVEVRSFADAQRQAWALSDAEGRFALPFVTPGSYVLYVEGRMVETFAVSDGWRQRPLEVRLPPTAR